MRLGLTIAALVLTAAEMTMTAAPPLSTIRDTIFKADGAKFTGRLRIEWRSFEASDTSFIGRQSVETGVVDGALSVRLVPTTNANSSAWYKVSYVSGGNMQFTEAWAVPPSSTPLRVRDVRIADPLTAPGTIGPVTTPVGISDVNGLQAELDLRPKKAAAFAPSRAAAINASGELAAVAGDPNDCVKVDGSSGPCGAGPAGVGVFVDGENPGGIVDGSNALFTLALTPGSTSSIQLYRNGMLQTQALDYTLAGNSIQFVTASVPQPGDVLIAWYRTAGTNNPPAATFVDAEIPGGAVDGTNAAFTLAAAPSPASSLQVFRNGILQKQTLDYTLAGGAIQFAPAAIPQLGDVLLAAYRIAPAGGTTPGVLCIGVGTSTSLTSSTSLATCAIPAATLKAGDRIEIRFDVSHDGGVSSGFQYQVLWGATVVVSKTATAAVTKATGLASGGVIASGTQWSSLAWGNNGLSLTADAGNATDSTTNALTIDFRGQMLGATGETIALLGYTVVRNPAP